MKKSDLVGRWKVRAWEQRYDSGGIVHPMGADLIGFIHYGEDDRVFTAIAKGERPKFITGGQWDADEHEKVEAYETFLSYAGTYNLSGSTIRHHVEISLYPNWIGGIQERQACFKDDLLYLSARMEEGTDQARTVNLIFERLSRS